MRMSSIGVNVITHLRSSGAEEAIRDRNADEEEAKEVPELGEEGVGGDKFRSLGRKKWEDHDEDGKGESFIEKMHHVRVTTFLFGHGVLVKWWEMGWFSVLGWWVFLH